MAERVSKGRHWPVWVLAAALVVGVGALALKPAFVRERADLFADVCFQRVKTLSMALRMYASDHDGRLPVPSRWSDSVARYLDGEDSFVCPEASGVPCGYAMSTALASQLLGAADAAGNTVLVFESDMGWNAAGGPELLPDEPRHYRYSPQPIDIYGMAAGNAVRSARKQNPDGTWAKQPEADVIWEPVVEE